eukprot:Nitzschia sp. Nitz4//scaffold8_size234185//194174//194596//NITZ4_001290-RA/size234185-snap-gene-0.24-mRNA-1//1//CDS//3329559905//6271//frame0
MQSISDFVLTSVFLDLFVDSFIDASLIHRKESEDTAETSSNSSLDGDADAIEEALTLPLRLGVPVGAADALYDIEGQPVVITRGRAPSQPSFTAYKEVVRKHGSKEGQRR